MTMMSVINPRGRTRRKTKRKMTAKQLRYFGPRKKRHTARKRRRNPVAAAPRRRARWSHTVRRRRSSSSRRRTFGSVRRRFGGLTSKVSRYGFGTFVPAAVGGVGALALDLAWGYLPMPAFLQSGAMAPIARLAGALGIGITAGMIMGRKFGQEVTAGATVVTVYDLVKGWLKTNYPSLPLSMYIGHGGRYNPGMNIGPARQRLNMYIGEYAPFYENEFTQDESGTIDYP